MDNYLKLLEESLQKKVSVLDEISDLNEQQRMVFQAENAELEDFDVLIEKKDELIDKIEQLDQGFETLYQRVSEQLQSNKDRYRDQIKAIQELIGTVTDKSMAVQAQEARNKALIEAYFSKKRGQIGENRRTANVALNYYRMQNSGVGSVYMDSKH